MVIAKLGRIWCMSAQEARRRRTWISRGIQTEDPGQQQIFGWAGKVGTHGERFSDERLGVVRRQNLMIHHGYLWQRRLGGAATRSAAAFCMWHYLLSLASLLVEIRREIRPFTTADAACPSGNLIRPT